MPSLFVIEFLVTRLSVAYLCKGKTMYHFERYLYRGSWINSAPLKEVTKFYLFEFVKLIADKRVIVVPVKQRGVGYVKEQRKYYDSK